MRNTTLMAVAVLASLSVATEAEAGRKKKGADAPAADASCAGLAGEQLMGCIDKNHPGLKDQVHQACSSTTGSAHWDCMKGEFAKAGVVVPDEPPAGMNKSAEGGMVGGAPEGGAGMDHGNDPTCAGATGDMLMACIDKHHPGLRDQVKGTCEASEPKDKWSCMKGEYEKAGVVVPDQAPAGGDRVDQPSEGGEG